MNLINLLGVTELMITQEQKITCQDSMHPFIPTWQSNQKFRAQEKLITTNSFEPELSLIKSKWT